MQAALEWEAPHPPSIDKDAHYLVLTNGGEWGDIDLMIRPGVAVKKMCEPQIVRGRPLLVAKINLPKTE